jgi:cold shock CspA family protein
MKETATVLWYCDKRGYGLAVTPQGKKLFIHRRNFQKSVHYLLVTGMVIECEIQEVVLDDFMEALNAGMLRDRIGMNHRSPRASANRPTPKRNPQALKIRVVEAPCSN